MGSHSAGRTFILVMLRKNCVCPHLLINRVRQTCIRKNINFIKVICSDTYCKQTKTNLLCQTKTGVNGIVDSLRILLNNKKQKNIDLIPLLLKSF